MDNLPCSNGCCGGVCGSTVSPSTAAGSTAAGSTAAGSTRSPASTTAAPAPFGKFVPLYKGLNGYICGKPGPTTLTDTSVYDSSSKKDSSLSWALEDLVDP